MSASENTRYVLLSSLFSLPYLSLYVSGSAYKIINARAYHHGTMLLDARIDLLGDILRNTKETMVGRSVASVRSPVRNIVEFKPDVTHESFSKALCAAFCEKFGAEIKVVEIGEEIMEKNAFAAERDFIEKSATELESWEWKYGQTLEFTHVIESTANERQLYANIVAKHGIITSCRLTMDGKEDGLQSLCADLVGKRYGMLQDSEFNIGTPELDVLHWLQHEM
ncbi:Biotin/lipoate A/B protein ligase [Serendipita sp. 405]|nr:Biotin/lipoate A/B protein ligase [Serendipita sp. 405]